MTRVRLIILGVILSAIVLSGALFAVDETEFAVITRFGEIQHVEYSPGLKMKTPFIDRVIRLDNRLLHIDVPTATMPDVQKQNLEIDAYVRYRINDPEKFLRRLVSELTAASRLGNIVISEIREEVARSTRSTIIGGESQETTDPETGEIVRTVTPLITRAEMMERVLVRSDQAVQSTENDFGVTIVDVRIKAADFPQATEESVFTRMRTEREVQATRLRNEGQRQSLTIHADVDRQVAIILAEAERDANLLRGQGEAEAIRLLATALWGPTHLWSFQQTVNSLDSFRPRAAGQVNRFPNHGVGLRNPPEKFIHNPKGPHERSY